MGKPVIAPARSRKDMYFLVPKARSRKSSDPEEEIDESPRFLAPPRPESKLKPDRKYDQFARPIILQKFLQKCENII